MIRSIIKCLLLTQIRYSLVVVIIGLSYSLSAQLNLKIGYNGGYSNMKQTTEVFDRYSDRYPNFEKRLKPVRFFNGLELGVRYKFVDHFAVEAGISNVSGDNKGELIEISATDKISNEYKLSMTHYYVGLESHFTYIGIGGNIGYQKLTYNNSINKADKTKIMSQNVLNSRFYLIFDAPSDNMSFSFRPFVSVNWEPYNIQDVELDLLPNSTRPKSDFDQDVLMFGISIIFYNGPQ